MNSSPPQEWFSASELAALGLPSVPVTRQGVEFIAKRDGWRTGSLARKKSGRGGGYEYHLTVLPAVAQARLTVEAARPEPKPTKTANWQEFEALPNSAKDKARFRLRVIEDIETLELGGLTRQLSVSQIARSRKVGERTIWNWLKLVEGVVTDSRLPALAPKHRLAVRKNQIADFDPEAFDALYADFMRPEQPAFSEVYRRTAMLSLERGWTLPPERTARRRFEGAVPPPAIILARKGIDALKRMYPAQERDKSDLHALECVNADGHRFDVFVKWPDGSIARPFMTAFQDIYSGLMLSWRIDVTENRISALLSFGDMVEKYGIPEQAVFDNGRGWASKWLTGGTPTRYRFKVRDDDPVGVLPLLGVQLHWTLPYSGQSKPIERAFRDLCEIIAKHPRLAGAYTGNKPDAKPENYGSRAVPLDEFMDVLATGIAEHNTRIGRRSPIAQGRSFQQTFDESYAEAIIRKASPEQRRLWLLGAEGLRGDTETGALTLLGSRFWSDWSWKLRKERVIARFDPEDLTRGLHVYALDGSYMGEVAMLERGKFLSLEDAQSHARARKSYMNAVKKMEVAQRAMKTKELAALHASLDDPKTPDEPRSKVIRPMFNGTAARAVAEDEISEIDSDLSWFTAAHARGVELSVVGNEEED